MRIVEHYSHLGGLEILLVNKPSIWEEIQDIIERVDATACRTKVSKEVRMAGKRLFSPIDMNKAFNRQFSDQGWKEDRVSYFVTSDLQVLGNPMYFQMTAQDQQQTLKSIGLEADSDYFRSYNQTDFVKDHVAVEIQFGKYSFVAYDLFVKHLAFYQQRKIEVGVEILPMKSLQKEMSSGPGYYEGELFNLARQGRGSPPVPLVLLGVAP
jgi:hypothetical protein